MFRATITRTGNQKYALVDTMKGITMTEASAYTPNSLINAVALDYQMTALQATRNLMPVRRRLFQAHNTRYQPNWLIFPEIQENEYPPAAIT